MARAHTVWLVVSKNDNAPLAAFTVKHELRSWLERKYDWQRANWDIWAVPDGAPDVLYDPASTRRSRFLCHANEIESELGR